MKIKFDIETYDKEIQSTNWVIDTSKPPPASIGDAKNRILITNIYFDDEEGEEDDIIPEIYSDN